MSSIIAEVEFLERRLDEIEEDVKTTRKHFDDHLTAEAIERKAMTVALEGIRFDVHAIREGKRAVLRMLSVGLFIVGAAGTGVVLAAKWALEHALMDWQTQHDPSRHKEIS